MSNLKALRNRINSVKSTQKITSAMKMVAAAKLRRTQEAIVAARPYAQAMEEMVASLSLGVDNPELMVGRTKIHKHLIVAAAADRGLCGGFNSHIVRRARTEARNLQGKSITPLFLCIGRKVAPPLQREWGDHIEDVVSLPAKGENLLDFAEKITRRIIELFKQKKVDGISLIYARFFSAIRQDVQHQSLVPLEWTEGQQARPHGGITNYEPDKEEVLNRLLPKNLRIQIYRALLENAASEQGARMTAMDNATRNASDMIGDLTLLYNRSRQAAITTELIEIISGAEAL